MIKVGDRIPSAKLTAVTPDGPKETSTEEIFGGKRVVLFAVPGAFTPTCSARHLPGYLEHSDAFRTKGIDTVACLAVNDHFVMGAWAKDQGVDGRLLMLADGVGAFTRALGLELDLTGRGLGVRSQRYAMLVEDGTIKSLSVERPGDFDVSKAETVLAGL
jgi:peroxiredoxin (alkyl hydroperoxide reductase subunit C)